MSDSLGKPIQKIYRPDTETVKKLNELTKQLNKSEQAVIIFLINEYETHKNKIEKLEQQVDYFQKLLKRVRVFFQLENNYNKEKTQLINLLQSENKQ